MCVERRKHGSEGGGRKSTSNGNSLASYPTQTSNLQVWFSSVCTRQSKFFNNLKFSNVPPKPCFMYSGGALLLCSSYTPTHMGTRSHCERHPYPHLPAIRAQANIGTCRYCSHCFCSVAQCACVDTTHRVACTPERGCLFSLSLALAL